MTAILDLIQGIFVKLHKNMYGRVFGVADYDSAVKNWKSKWQT